jgi:superfamily II DNA or RNA helicase
MFDASPPAVDVMIVDEAQHDGARSMATLHATLQPKKLLGLTATPFRSDRIKLCFEQVIRDIGIQQLIQAGYLSKYRHFTVPAWQPTDIAARFASERERWGQSLIFFHRLQQCMECQQALAACGVPSEVVTGSSNRDRQIDAFRSGEIKVLLSMAILAEGFDCPELQTVFCRPSGRGCTIQMCGRVFRRHPAVPLKQIVQSRCTRYPITKTADAAEQYVHMNGHWRSLHVNEQANAVGHNMLQLLSQCRTQLPDHVTKHRRSRRAAPWQT